ncbi:hypothetical protein [Actinoplanes derwentensis]|uniref:Uncharacterized protein n=1 Tax=Actinoplanes derwentensis TaxID=113562 RepID=A0A1H2CPX5_9ACTN|nr:hypothetical protein [Actinoplanes derwentensis]GID83893.1 hypothetical protein Ade03nite_28170 [Actinoplanes derwentensis]SDT72384.1 hypothetical protein SAMN04489716_6396 [Actinoplanes derwentensis]
MKDSLSLGRAAARWAGGFYLRHVILVLGLSLIPTAQRFTVISQDVPPAVSIAGEVLVMLVRILLFVLVVRLMLDELAAAGIGRRESWARLKAGLHARRLAFWGQWVLLIIAFVIFDVLPETLIATVVPESARETATAWLVAVKNPTVIAFTMLWLVGIARTLIIDPDPAAPSDDLEGRLDPVHGHRGDRP